MKERVSVDYHLKAARESLKRNTPDDGWRKVDTPDAILKALVGSSEAAWPSIWSALEAMREEYGE